MICSCRTPSLNDTASRAPQCIELARCANALDRDVVRIGAPMRAIAKQPCEGALIGAEKPDRLLAWRLGADLEFGCGEGVCSMGRRGSEIVQLGRSRLGFGHGGPICLALASALELISGVARRGRALVQRPPPEADP